LLFDIRGLFQVVLDLPDAVRNDTPGHDAQAHLDNCIPEPHACQDLDHGVASLSVPYTFSAQVIASSVASVLIGASALQLLTSSSIRRKPWSRLASFHLIFWYSSYDLAFWRSCASVH